MADGFDELGLTTEHSAQTPAPRYRYLVLGLLAVGASAAIALTLLVVVPMFGRVLIWFTTEVPWAPGVP